MHVRCAVYGRLAWLELFLEEVDLCAPDAQGWTALDWAIAQGSSDEKPSLRLVFKGVKGVSSMFFMDFHGFSCIFGDFRSIFAVNS